MDSTHEERLRRARIALEGLSVGDAFGDRFFMHADLALALIRSRAIPKAPWEYTDDTNMALSIYQILRQHQKIDQRELARSFATHYDSKRGYGPAMHGLLSRIRQGESWESAAADLFSGQGSYGNGGAMRVAPIGAYFADDLEAVIENARLSAEITHAHPEGIAGAIAVAVATAVAYRLREANQNLKRSEFIEQILPFIPPSEVKSKVQRAAKISTRTSVENVTAMLGNGYQVTAQDTVPFVLWSAGENLLDYEQAIWQTASALGDVDTTCAMVGGIVAMYTGIEGIPAEWINRREPLPEWAFED